MSSAAAAKAPIQVALVEDDEEIRANLSYLIGHSPSFRLAGSYPDAESALAELPRRNPQVVLMDINLPGADGVECVRQLKAQMPQVQFIMLTVYEDGNRLFKSLMAGASGYLLKRTPPEKLLAAIEEAHTGGGADDARDSAAGGSAFPTELRGSIRPAEAYAARAGGPGATG